MICNCPYCNKDFNNWAGVRGHIPSCNNNSGEFFIDLNEGSINFYEIKDLDQFYIHLKYPKLKSSLGDIKKSFKRRGFDNISFQRKWDKKEIIVLLQNFVKTKSRLPEQRDIEFNNPVSGYPSFATIRNTFGSWNRAIEEAGFKPNLQNGFGIDTYGLDGHLYRSRYEALFSNKFLFKKYKYIIEPKYPKPYNKYYDWYLPKLDLYIELDGEIRPQVLLDKIKINKSLNRNLFVVNKNDIRKYKYFPW